MLICDNNTEFTPATSHHVQDLKPNGYSETNLLNSGKSQRKPRLSIAISRSPLLWINYLMINDAPRQLNITTHATRIVFTR